MGEDDGAQSSSSVGLVGVLVGATYVGAGNQAIRSLIGRDPWNWLELLLHGGAWALGMGIVAVMLRAGWIPSWGDAEGRAMLRDALRTGELPPGARPEAWRRLLKQEVDETRQLRCLGVSLLALNAVLVAVAAAVVNDNAWTLWALAVALGALLVIPVRRLGVRAERAEALLARLDPR